MKSEVLTFTLTDAYVKLLKQANVCWQDCETGAPEIDPKRPYGNSDVWNDVAEILNLKAGHGCANCGDPCEKCADGAAGEKFREECLAIHRGTEYALQIVLQHGYRLGTYKRNGYREWVLLA